MADICHEYTPKAQQSQHFGKKISLLDDLPIDMPLKAEYNANQLEVSNPMEIPKITLKAARVNAGLTQEAAALSLGVSRATLQNYEDGSTVPSWEFVKKIEAIYKFPADYIFFQRNSA